MSASLILATGLTEAVLELSLYGAFTVIFSAVVYLFWTRGLLSKDRPIFFVFVAIVLLFLTITAVCFPEPPYCEDRGRVK